MKFFCAYVPFTEKWIVFSGTTVVSPNLSEDQAARLAQALNAIEANYFEPKIRTIEEFNFEKIYEEYPRKLGKSLGIRRLQQKIKTKERYDLLLNAVINFKHVCEMAGTEEKFIPHFSTWVNKWEDYIPSNEAGGVKEDSLSLDDITKRMDQ